MDEETSTLTPDQRAAALSLAERAAEYGARHGDPLPLDDTITRHFPDGERATFVSLYVDDDLSGCVGKLQPTRPLACDIVFNTFSAAFEDQRFPPLQPEDLPLLAVQISVLDPLERVPAQTEKAVWEYVEPGRHGLLLQSDAHRGTFLPTVWEKCPDRETFMAHLKKKAGIPIDAWPDELAVFRYTVDAFDRDTLES